MRINGLKIKHFIPHRDSGITEIVAKFIGDVDLFIGPNGSGKSVTLSQLSLYPTPKPMFEDKKGNRTLEIEHKGISYTLESDYEKPSSPHGIYEDGNPVNLNQGGTTDIQKEMIVELFGVTPILDNLIMNRGNFPKLTSGARKDFLKDHNPENISFIFQKHKEILSQIKACKNNLARLQSRKIMREQEMLSEEEVENLIKEKDQLSEDLGHFTRYLMDLEVGTRMIGTITPPTSLYDVDGIKQQLKRVRQQLWTMQEVARDDVVRQRRRESLRTAIATCVQYIEDIDKTLLEQAQQLNELEARYRELTPDGDLQDIEQTIQRLERDRDRLFVKRPEFELSEDQLHKFYQEWEVVRDKLQVFEGCDVPLYPTRKRQHREKMLQMAQYKLSSYDMTLNDLKRRYQEIEKRHTISPRDIPDQPCAKGRCPLYAHFMEGYQDAEAERQTLLSKIRKVEYRHNRVSQFAHATTQYFTNTELYSNHISWLVGYAQDNPVLYRLLKSIDVLVTLKNNPHVITRRLKEAYDHIDTWLKLSKVLEDLSTAYTLRERFMGTQDQDAVKLVVEIDSIKTSIFKQRESLQTYIDKRKGFQEEYNRILKYDELKAQVLQIQNTHLEYLNYLSDQHELDCLKYLHRTIFELNAQGYARYGNLCEILQSQSSVKLAYKEEIVDEIARIEQERSELEKIERALYMIPKDSTVRFINAIFKQANVFISQVWTIPFQIDLISIDDPLTYEFSVSGDNESVREMSKCSEGQTEILNLAINLALRVKLGFLDYPLCLDETGRTLDETHKRNLVSLLKRLLEDGIISQLFLVSHTALIHEAFPHAETMVLREENVTLPEFYNQHCTIR